MKQLTPINIINILPSTLEQGELFKTKIKAMILSGEENPLRLAVQLTALEKWVGELRKDSDIERSFLIEAEKQNSKSFEMFGAKMIVKEVGVTYDFSVCDDNILEELEQELIDCKNRFDKRKEFLKSISEKNPVFDGQGIELHPPVKTSKTKVTVELK